MRPGELIAGRFELERLAGSGGMARVYRARDRQAGSVVAVKLLHGEGAADADRFAREARVLAELSHPAVVRYVAHGTTGEGDRFIVMEWLEGEDLAERLHRGPLEVAEAVALGRRISEGLGMAHRHAIVHRDVKPGNVFLPGGRVADAKVLDFGIARHEHLTRRLTRTGMTMGTPGYMSPEQARGDAETDPRTDVFALGCVLFECLAGRPAFIAAHAAALLGMILFEDPPRLATLKLDVPTALDELVLRMLSKDPDERPADGDVAARLLGAVPTERIPVSTRSSVSLTQVEQRLVSVVVVGTGSGASAPTLPWTNAGEGRAPIEALRDAARPHRGRVELLADGSVVAVLPGDGLPVEQAARAARCALAMRSTLADLPMMLATGRGVVGGAMPVGEVIDRALLALDDAPPNAVGIDEPTAKLLDARFDVHAEPRSGSPEASPRFVLRGERAPMESTRTLLGKPTRCVGRDRELALFEASWETSVAEPRASAVLVIGAPGVGKTRLSHEFLQRVRSSDRPPVEMILARGDPLSAGSAFGLMAPAIRRWAGVLDGEPVELQRDKLLAAVSNHGSAGPVERIATFLGELAGVRGASEGMEMKAARGDAMLMGDQMRAAWEDWHEAICAVGPVLIVLEDLHWGDLPSVHLIDSALRRLRDAPLMVLALARPEVRERFPSLWAERDVVEVRLGGLSRRSSAELVRDVLGERLTPQELEELVVRADGNALYLEELVRAKAEGAEGRLPDGVLGMVQARFDAVEPEARRVLRAASVFGQSFWRGGVAALLGADATGVRIDEWLEELVQRELVTRRPRAVFHDELEYRFRHDVIREAAYAMLTEADRVLGHRLAGGWLERKGESDPVILAEHYERGGDAMQAITWYECAAEEALEGNDFAAAVQRAERGIACGAEGVKRGVLRLVQAEAYGWRGAFEKAQGQGELAMQDLPVGTGVWFRAVGELVYASAPLGRPDAVLSWADRLMTTPAADPSAVGPRVVALSRVAFHLVSLGEYARAGELQREAQGDGLALVESDSMVAARLHQTSGFARFALDDLTGALDEYILSADLFQCAGALRQKHFAATQASFVYLELGQYAEAELLLRETHAVSERMGLTFSAVLARVNLSFALVRQGLLSDPLVLGGDALRSLSRLEDRRVDGMSRCYLAEIMLMRGAIEDAEREAERAMDQLAPFLPVKARALATLAMVLLAAGRVAEALDAASEGMTILERLGTIITGESMLRLAHARALYESGEHAAATTAIATAQTRMIERASRLVDRSASEAFFATTEHAEIAALAAKWIGQGAP